VKIKLWFVTLENDKLLQQVVALRLVPLITISRQLILKKSAYLDQLSV